MELAAIRIESPMISMSSSGQAHFIKTPEDLHEALAGSSLHLRFGIAFCEASAQRLARQSVR